MVGRPQSNPELEIQEWARDERRITTTITVKIRITRIDGRWTSRINWGIK